MINRKITVSGTSIETVSLDLERLYRVDYLLADEGTEISSQFGHSMLRLVFCAPGVNDPENCLNDISHHVVVSFRASITDRSSSDLAKNSDLWEGLKYYLKGLGIAGSFPSKMFLMTMTSVIGEYNQFDFRDLPSTPLKLSKQEKLDLLNRILEIEHGYSGSYNFFTNNCKTETEDLLKAIVRNPKMNKFGALTPVDLRDVLYKMDMVEKDTLGEKRFRSFHHYVKENFNNLRQIFSTYQMPNDKSGLSQFLASKNPNSRTTTENYIDDYSPEQRQIFILSLKNSFDKNLFSKEMPLPEYIKILKNLWSIEYAARTSQEIKIDLLSLSLKSEILQKNYANIKNFLTTGNVQEAIKNIESLRSKIANLMKQNVVYTNGYGIAKKEDRREEPYQWLTSNIHNQDLTPDELKNLEKNLSQMIKIIIADEFLKLKQINENINLIDQFKKEKNI